ncbi:hypothetical protein GH714_022545 [Hevea brasiliensis]|uniref:Btz domain-containing protein n=1 Tax=Hevea brasiliensis TaxID=3981 RepID=A0A6A6LL89_HEVBR|nr:hypothetical protein GH714_022545 [Hevea brasiliensis]
MAKVGEEDVEYDSDPEEEKRMLGMRRREAASDDEEGEGEDKTGMDRRAIHSDELDVQGGAEYESDPEEEKRLLGMRRREAASDDEDGEGEEKPRMDRRAFTLKNPMARENEPFAVPTAGAFYMHDDRFKDNAGGRHRRTYGGRKLWESKDDKKWGHDKFEEMNLQERHYEQGRRGSKGNFRGRGGKSRLQTVDMLEGTNLKRSAMVTIRVSHLKKRNVQAGSTSRNIRTSVINESFSMQQASALARGKNIADSVGIDKLYSDDSYFSGWEVLEHYANVTWIFLGQCHAILSI